MITGIVRLDELDDGLNLNANHYLNECANCGGQLDNPQHHDQHDRCHRLQRLFVRNGRHFRNRYGNRFSRKT